MKKNKKIIGLVLGIILILVIVIGATYAFFQISVKNDKTEASININAGELSNIALKQGITKLKVKVTAEEMGVNKKGDYYATANEEENYTKDSTPVKIAQIEGEGTINHRCTADIVVSIEGNLVEELQEIYNE